MGSAASRPIARRQPGVLARVASIEAVAVAARGLVFVCGTGGDLGRDGDLRRIGRRIRRRSIIEGATTFQVLVGLLLLSVCAATSLAEERVRGSLDILLSTPMSTREILAGKWWGAFRLAPHVLLWPAITGGLLVADSGRWMGYLLLMGLVLAYAAVIASLGLAIATWVSRLGRAVAICVSFTVVFAIGWVVLVLVIGSRDSLGLGLPWGARSSARLSRRTWLHRVTVSRILTSTSSGLEPSSGPWSTGQRRSSCSWRRS